MYRLRDAELKRVASLGALDRLSVGVVLLDRHASVEHVNAQAKRMLGARDGLSLAGQGLVAGDPSAAACLARAIESALRDDLLEAQHFSSTVAVPRSCGRRPYLLQFAPLPRRNSFSGGARVIVFITDPDREVSLDPAILGRSFGITPAEARLAARLCAGDTLASAAQHCDVAETTAKTQLARLFQKTNARSQAQLVRLLLSLASAREYGASLLGAPLSPRRLIRTMDAGPPRLDYRRAIAWEAPRWTTKRWRSSAASTKRPCTRARGRM
jgi:DNA-binding CsgD family transcriptional regulator